MVVHDERHRSRPWVYGQLVAHHPLRGGEQARVRSLIEDWDSKNFAEIFELLRRYRALTQSQTIIYREIERAQQAIGRVSGNEGSLALVALGDFLAQQTEALGVSTGRHGHYDSNSRP